MLKQIIINQRSLPVPLPIQNVGQAVRWLEESMIPDGHSLTAIKLDGKDLFDRLGQERFINSLKLHNDSELEIRIEAPIDLALETLEAGHNLCRAILSSIKVVAVNLWQSPVSEDHDDVSALVGDFSLIDELMDHAKGLGVEQTVDIGKIEELRTHLKELVAQLDQASHLRRWRDCAILLLRDQQHSPAIESTLKILQEEFEAAHLRLLTVRPSIIRRVSAGG